MSLKDSLAGKWATVPMAQIRHEVKSQWLVRTAGVIAEASEW